MVGFHDLFCEEAGILNAAMAVEAHGQVSDIGGGRGHLLQAVIGCTPSAKGVRYTAPDPPDLELVIIALDTPMRVSR